MDVYALLMLYGSVCINLLYLTGFTKKNDAKSVETAPVEILCYC